MRLEWDGDNFKKVFKFLSELRSVAPITKTEDGKAIIRVVDYGNVAMGVVEFSEGVIVEEGDEMYILPIDRIAEMASSLRKSDDVVMTITKEGVKIRVRNMVYEAPLLVDEEVKMAKEPEIELTARVVLNGEEFKNLLKVAKKQSDVIRFEGGAIIAKGDVATLKMNVEEAEGEGSAMYSIELLEAITKLVGSKDTVVIEYGDRMPCRVSVDLGIAKVKYYVAPRIEEE